ncbi:hypothetical protein [Rhizobium metallidurans]|uniref:Uncharacterized protein n=1 Tax=Rhizobium metallidurans TaxID=1265931 RepID=A0A7W6GDY0_9HYPH|nr:hypothetical protein [Rhizobium metallidurans]MBB3967374.1 hypothetical protein [Rhizobium metallidurans]
MPRKKPCSKADIERRFKQIEERYLTDKPAGHTCSVAELNAILMAECERLLSL